MQLGRLKQPLVNGAVSTVISLPITYLYHDFIHASGDIEWALIAVAIAAFLSGFFSTLEK